MRKQLTKAMIDKLGAPAKGRIEIFDATVPAMALRVTSNGAKTFVVRCRVKGQPDPIRITIGDALGMKLEAARDEASDVLRMCRAGDDPREAKKLKLAETAEREGNTVGAVAEEFLKRHVARLRSAKIAEGVIRRELLGQVQEGEGEEKKWVDDRRNTRWRERPITEIKRRDVVKLLEEIIDRGNPYLARYVLALTKKMFRWAISRDTYGLEANPCADVSAKDCGAPAIARKVTLANDHLRLVWKAAGKLGEPWCSYFRSLLLGGQRRNEFARLQWPELDTAEKVIVIPPERMKAKRPHEVPLSPAMVEIFNERRAKRGNEGDYVFSTTNGRRPISGFAKAKKALDEAVAELRNEELEQARKDGQEVRKTELPKWRLHDLRRTMRTGMGAIPTIPHDIRELVIAHVPAALVQTYDLHSYREEKRDALTKWSEKLSGIVSPSSADAAASKVA